MPDTYALTPHETVTVLERTPERLVVEGTWTPSAKAPPRHQHPEQDERFTVLEGELSVSVAGAQRVVAAGESFDVPRGTTHAMWNASAAPVRVRWETMPAGRTEAFWQALTSTSRRNPAAMARLLFQFRDTFRLAR